jgi:F0F1-type ATP synthase assembly protein I
MFKLGNRDDLRLYLQHSQVGFEMVVPICIGLALDHYLDWSPWGVTVGAVLGLAVGLLHIVWLTNRADAPSRGDQDSKSGAT